MRVGQQDAVDPQELESAKALASDFMLPHRLAIACLAVAFAAIWIPGAVLTHRGSPIGKILLGTGLGLTGVLAVAGTLVYRRLHAGLTQAALEGD